MHISQSSSPIASDNSAKERKRANGRAWRQNRDQTVLAAMRKAEAAAAPPSKQPGDRVCLGCGRTFLSTWCGNRRCKLCADNNP